MIKVKRKVAFQGEAHKRRDAPRAAAGSKKPSCLGEGHSATHAKSCLEDRGRTMNEWPSRLDHHAPACQTRVKPVRVAVGKTLLDLSHNIRPISSIWCCKIPVRLRAVWLGTRSRRSWAPGTKWTKRRKAYRNPQVLSKPGLVGRSHG